MRVGGFAKRGAGAPAQASEWATRKIPSPAARIAFAAIEDHETFAARWPVAAGRLGIRPHARLRAGAGGARWIWGRLDFHFAFARGTLDIDHVLGRARTPPRWQARERRAGPERWQEQ